MSKEPCKYCGMWHSEETGERCELAFTLGSAQARIAELEEALRHAADTLQDTGLPHRAGRIRKVLDND